MTWAIPRLWSAASVAVLASGPSMSAQAAEQVRAAGLPSIAVNTTFRLAPWAAMLYAADAAWWHHTPDAHRFAGLKVTMEDVPGVHRIGRGGKVGYSDDPVELHTFGNSGAQAIQIAAKAGASRILLLGMDMDGSHWHGEHPTPLRSTVRDLYPIWCDWMAVLATELAQRDIEVLNCSPTSRLEHWPKVALEDALAGAERAA